MGSVVFTHYWEQSNQTIELEIDVEIEETFGSKKISNYNSVVQDGKQLSATEIESLVEDIGEDVLEEVATYHFEQQFETELEPEYDTETYQLAEELGIKVS